MQISLVYGSYVDEAFFNDAAMKNDDSAECFK